MKNFKLLNYFTKNEIILWSLSVLAIVSSFLIFDRVNYLTLSASLIGVTSLIFNAKGNPVGQLLMVVFSVLYSIISLKFKYYGEMITYSFMTAPMSVFALISWLRNPFEGDKSQVKVDKITKKQLAFASILTAFITFIFYFVLKYFNTANLLPSTISVTTSFIAVYLTYKRSPYYALGYAANDVVLIVLWTLASFENLSYLSVVVCFIAFLINDIYGFISWKKMEKFQHEKSASEKSKITVKID